MQSVLADWTVVVTGAWNANIFSPQWVAANVFHGENVNIEMQLGPTLPFIRFHHGRVTLIVQPDLLIGTAREATPEALSDIIDALRTILNMLPHTPITGPGINFGFREETPSAAIIANFNIADNPKLIDFGGEISQTSIQREVMLDNNLLRLRETFEPTGAIHFHLNFHYDLIGAVMASEILQQHGAGRRERALALMNEIYNLQPE